MIDTVHIVSDGIVLVFTDGAIKYLPAVVLRELGSELGCHNLLDYDPSGDPSDSPTEDDMKIIPIAPLRA